MDELEKAKAVLKEAYEDVDNLLLISKVTEKAEMSYSLIKDGYKIEITVMSADGDR